MYKMNCCIQPQVGRFGLLVVSLAFVALLCPEMTAADEPQPVPITLEPLGRRIDIPQRAPDQAIVPPNLPRTDLTDLKQDAASRSIAPGGQAIEDVPPTGPLPSAPARGNSFPEISDTGWFPPDGALAAGPRYLVAVTNGAVAYLTKDGDRVFQTDLGTFFGSSGSFDPRVLYDQGSDRFFILALNGTNPATSQIRIAVSNSSNPRDGWCFYNPFSGANPAGTWADYPTLGVNNIAVFFGTNQFGSSFTTNRLLWLDKTPMLTCSSTGGFDNTGLKMGDGTTAFAVQPAHSFGTPPSNVEFLAASWSSSGNEISVWRLDDPLGTNPMFTAASRSVGPYSAPPDAPEPGGGRSLDTGDARLLNLVWRNNRLWMSHNGAGFICDTGSCSSLFIKEFDTSGFPTVTVVQDFHYGANGYFYMYPAIAVNDPNDMGVSFSRTSAPYNEFPSLRHTGRLGSDAPNTLQGSAQLQAGTANYQESDSIGRNRWGDYFGASVDTCANKGMWVEGEYATGTTTWNKWTANTFSQSSPVNNTCLPAISMGGFPYANSQDTTFATFEEQDLVQSCGDSGNPGNNASVWYFFTAPGNGQVTIDTFGSDYDTVLSVYSQTGACSGLAELACNDDTGGPQSEITFPVVAGQVYDVLITEYSDPDCDSQTLEVYATATFATSIIFADGFESGDTSAWSATVP